MLVKFPSKPCLDLFPHARHRLPSPCSQRLLNCDDMLCSTLSLLGLGFLQRRELCLVPHCAPKLCLEHSDLSLSIYFPICAGCLSWETPVLTCISSVALFHPECCVLSFCLLNCLLSMFSSLEISRLIIEENLPVTHLMIVPPPHTHSIKKGIKEQCLKNFFFHGRCPITSLLSSSSKHVSHVLVRKFPSSRK